MSGNWNTPSVPPLRAAKIRPLWFELHKVCGQNRDPAVVQLHSRVLLCTLLFSNNIKQFANVMLGIYHAFLTTSFRCEVLKFDGNLKNEYCKKSIISKYVMCYYWRRHLMWRQKSLSLHLITSKCKKFQSVWYNQSQKAQVNFYCDQFCSQLVI